MQSDWPTATLGELTINLDTKRRPVKEADRRSGPYPYYGASGIVDHVDGFLFEGEHLLIAEDGENLRTRNTPVAFRATGRFWVNNHAHIVKGNGLARTRFLEYAVLAADLTPYLTGAVMPKLTQGNLNKIELPCPPLKAQDAVIGVLGSLDDRIALLRQTNATLESIAQALFKSWFIDFDPVRAKAEGREPEGMDAATAALFPAGFEESALGPIPKGWEVRSLDSFASYLNGLALQKYPPESEDEYLPVIKIAQLRAGHTVAADRASARLKPEYIVRDGDVLFSWSGSLEVEFWCGGDGALNQHLFKVTSDEVPKWFYYLATRHFLPGFREIAAHKATTMGHIQRKHLTEARIALPPTPVLHEAGRAGASLVERRIANSLQARQLAELRDALLPRLISGKLRLPEAEREIEEALA
ncbi:restriction endonuclease subunit S [Pseudoxanthomonas kaohsiungensis]|uniref:Restriction endonuclease subunit S n=1 Tax=Pseudoxanthomonas kaohsiungensis TaxID=283923 RepID=A0ABW3M0X7_9GAMM|nr:restriction endonuclease subunit S [Pseudoxanthomonas kaohsiungensis]KAF1700298.1 type I restriction endonuclease subunit S [Pseudoxanthomonas kaohsiungensis]